MCCSKGFTIDAKRQGLSCDYCTSTACAITACSASPAGLSGCCNHVTATLYCLEDYIHSGLQDDEQKGCTDRLQTWNQPRKRNAEARPTDEVILTKEERLKIHQINKWDCRIVDPNKARKLRERLSIIEESKIAPIDNAVLGAKSPEERRKASVANLCLQIMAHRVFFTDFR